MPKSDAPGLPGRVFAAKEIKSRLSEGTAELMNSLETLWRQKRCVVRVPAFPPEALPKHNLPEEDASPAKRDLARLPAPFREYYESKGRNFLRSIRAFRPLWDCFMLLDKIVARELEALDEPANIHKMFPLIPFQNAHSKMRLAAELGFSGCLSDAHLILRDAIESVAHGHRIFSDPKRLEVWLAKNEETPGASGSENELWYETEECLFGGLEELHKLWKELSPHTNMDSIISHFEIEENPSPLEGQLSFTGIELQLVVQALFDLLVVFQQFEEVLYKDCEDLLKKDLKLSVLRRKFQKAKEAIRKGMIDSLKVRSATA